MPNGTLSFLPDRVATAWLLDRDRSDRFLCRLTRFLGRALGVVFLVVGLMVVFLGPVGVAIGSALVTVGVIWISVQSARATRLARGGLSPERLRPDTDAGEVLVGCENTFRFRRCWTKTDFAFRGAVRFNLAGINRGFQEHQNAWLTWNVLTGDRAPRNFGPGTCTPARAVGTAVEAWEGGFYPHAARRITRDLTLGETLHVLTDEIRAVNVTREVREWVEGIRPNNGFVLMGDERFARPGEPTFGRGVIVGGTEDSPYGTIWQRCAAILMEFRLELHDLGFTPPGAVVRPGGGGG